MGTIQRTERQPSVSIILAAHNEERWVEACLESVLKVDNYPNKEVIVIDDASTDRTSEIIEQFPVIVIRNERSVGPSSARNIGVERAEGEIVVFVDAHCMVDDPEWIQKFVRFFRDPQVGAVGGYFRRDCNKSRLSLTFGQSESRLRLIKSANAAYRKAVFEQVGGFDPSLEWGGDAALTFKVHRSGWKIVHSRDIMVIHAEKIWPARKAFLYGTCFFPLRKEYPRERPVRGLLLSPMIIGITLTFGLALDFLCRLPIFTPSIIVLVSVLNGVAAHISVSHIITDGFYTTIWCFAYYLGALYGGLEYITRELLKQK